MTTRIESILDTVDYCDIGNDDKTYELFDTIKALVNRHELYKADIRIAGLYYRSGVDTTKLYALGEYTKYSSNCEIRYLYEELQKPMISNHHAESSVESFQNIIEHVGEILQDGGRPIVFPFDPAYYLKFERQPENKHDKNAIAVYFLGKHAGYVPADHAKELVAKYSDDQINNAIGIVRKHIGDQRVTFDIYPLKAKVPKKKVAMKEEKADDKWNDGYDIKKLREDIDWEKEEKQCTAELKAIKEDKEKKAAVKPYPEKWYTGCLHHDEALGYTVEFNGTEWVTWVGTSRYNKENYKIERWDGSNWVEYIVESQATTDISVPVTSTGSVNVSNITVATTAFVTSCIETTKQLSTVDYRQFTGFMRTLLEYASFAHLV